MTKKINIIISDKSTMSADLIEAARILYYLNYYTRQWQQHFGYENRRNRDRWQSIADKWLSQNVQIETINEG